MIEVDFMSIMSNRKAYGGKDEVFEKFKRDIEIGDEIVYQYCWRKRENKATLRGKVTKLLPFGVKTNIVRKGSFDTGLVFSYAKLFVMACDRARRGNEGKEAVLKTAMY